MPFLTIAPCIGGVDNPCSFSHDLLGTPAQCLLPQLRCALCDSELLARLLEEAPQQVWILLARAWILDAGLYRRACSRVAELSKVDLAEVTLARHALNIDRSRSSVHCKIQLLTHAVHTLSKGWEDVQDFCDALRRARNNSVRLACLRSLSIPLGVLDCTAAFLSDFSIATFLVRINDLKHFGMSAGNHPLFWPCSTGHIMLLEDYQMLGRTYKVLFLQVEKLLRQLTYGALPDFAQAAALVPLQERQRSSRDLQQALLAWQGVS